MRAENLVTLTKVGIFAYFVGGMHFALLQKGED